MRQVIFVVVMLAAAFAGGALVNGAAVRWVQARLLDYMGLKDGGEIASVDLSQNPGDPVDPHRPGSPPAASSPGTQRGEPVAGGQPDTKDRADLPAGGPARPFSPSPASRSNLTSDQKPGGAVAGTPRGQQLSPAPLDKDSFPGQAAANLRPGQPNGNPASMPTPAPLDPSVGTALLASRSPSLSLSGPMDQVATAAIPLETAPTGTSGMRPLPALAGMPEPSVMTPSATRAPAPLSPRDSRPTQDWAALRRKLQTLGVTRYSIEGEPGGRVVFWCLIPLAGRQAVSQRFEGEGEDEFYAAQAALRRMALACNQAL